MREVAEFRKQSSRPQAKTCNTAQSHDLSPNKLPECCSVAYVWTDPSEDGSILSCCGIGLLLVFFLKKEDAFDPEEDEVDIQR